MSEPTKQYMKDRLQESADAQTMTVYCLLCPKWRATGTAAVTRAASEAHRTKNHPEIGTTKTKIVRRSRAFSTSMSAEREAEIEEERRQRMRTLGIA
jgi:hypothetical protein